MDGKRLVIVTDAWHPQINGVVTTLTNMVDQGKKNGYDVHVIHPGLFKTKFYSSKYPEIPITLPLGLSKMLKEIDADYVHVATEGPLGLFASMYLTFHLIKYTTSYHTNWAPFMKEICGVPGWMTLRYLKWFHYRKTVFCPTKTTRDFLIDNRIGRKVVLWSRGVDLKNYDPPVSSLRNEKPVLISVGRVSKEKNLNEFCSLDREQYRLVVVGDGPYLEELRSAYPWIEFTGFKTGRELAELYQSADCLVFNSTNDTFGIVMIEAMVAGTPVAAHRVAGPVDVVDEGITGYLSDDISLAIERCLELSRIACAEHARAKWSWETVWDTFIDTIKIFAKKRKRKIKSSH